VDTILALPLAVVMYGAIPLYAGLQVLSLLRRRGWGLALSLVPLAPMAWVVTVTWQAWTEGSTPWPLFLILAAPVAALWLWLVGRLSPAR
jgi:hypothetical protein